jgi:prophage maintenance system killer protein
VQRVFEEITSYVCAVLLHVFIEYNKREQLFSLYVMLMFLELLKISNFQAVTNE